jgi:hypothetical protein
MFYPVSSACQDGAPGGPGGQEPATPCLCWREHNQCYTDDDKRNTARSRSSRGITLWSACTAIMAA